jgi:hypothetical protein
LDPKTEKPLQYEEILVKIPFAEYSRLGVFLDDIYDATEGECSITFNGLTSILLADFLKQISIGLPLASLANTLQAKQNKYLKSIQSDLKQQSQNRWVLVESKIPEPRQKYKIISFHIHPKAMRRMNFLLLDLNLNDPNFSMTVEEIVTILLRDIGS